jgi:hypothetical protein
VWFKVQGGLDWPHGEDPSSQADSNLYRPLSVVLSAR